MFACVTYKIPRMVSRVSVIRLSLNSIRSNLSEIVRNLVRDLVFTLVMRKKKVGDQVRDLSKTRFKSTYRISRSTV